MVLQYSGYGPKHKHLTKSGCMYGRTSVNLNTPSTFLIKITNCKLCCAMYSFTIAWTMSVVLLEIM
jgi:hypothetical protein